MPIYQNHLKRNIRKNRNLRAFGISALFSLAALALATVFPIYLKSDFAEATPTESETTLTMIADAESANLDLVVNSGDGTFAASSIKDQAKFSIITNNYTGYTLSISGGDDNGLLTNRNTGDMLKSIEDSLEESAFDSNANNGKWGYLPSKCINNCTAEDIASGTATFTSLTEDKYLPAPKNTTSTTLDTTNSANATANIYAISLGARVDYTLASGTYSNTYTLTATANPVAYVINYLDASGDTVSGLPSATAGTTKLTKVTLSSATPTRSLYTFKSWCLQTEASIVPVNITGAYYATTCNTTEYTAGGVLDFIDQTADTNTANLYAVWNPPSNTTFANAYKAANSTLRAQTTYSGTAYYTMQNMRSEICSAVADGQTATLLDNRVATPTGSTKFAYTVAKINGNCWMSQDLKYGYNTTVPSAGNYYSMAVPSSTTNIDSDKTLRFYDITTNATSSSGVCYGTLSGSNPTGAGLTNLCIHTGPNSYTDGNTVWYNYAAISAGTITGPSNSTIATSDLCPKNWQLPTSSQNGSLGGTTYVSLYKPHKGGRYAGATGTANYVGTYGMWWSRTADGTFSRTSMYYNRRVADSLTTSSDIRSYAHNARCLAQ